MNHPNTLVEWLESPEGRVIRRAEVLTRADRRGDAILEEYRKNEVYVKLSIQAIEVDVTVYGTGEANTIQDAFNRALRAIKNNLKQLSEVL